jgi:uncharacterized peroxidase-related enzyme
MSSKPIAHISVILQNEATGSLAEAYNTVKDGNNNVENLYLAMSQTPDAIVPADAHYMALLHNLDNPLDPSLSELVATYVAILCQCEYAIANHGANFRMYLSNDARADAILSILADDDLSKIENDEMRAALEYTRKLSLTPESVQASDIEALRTAGFCDKGISYIIQIAASFGYWARMINGLGTRLGAQIGIMGNPDT